MSLLVTKCDDCKKGKTHYHKVKYKTDFWQPTPLSWVCYCGKPYVHYHYDHKLQLIEGKKNG